MRNFSMKKFGTPMRAGPGWESEIGGLSSDGEPSVLTVGFAGSGFLARSTLPTSDSLLASTVWLPVFGGFKEPPTPGVVTGLGECEVSLPAPSLEPWSLPDGRSEPPPP